jgi:hypothetical protein
MTTTDRVVSLGAYDRDQLHRLVDATPPARCLVIIETDGGFQVRGGKDMSVAQSVYMLHTALAHITREMLDV